MDAEMDTIPVSTEAMFLLIMISQQNPGMFVNKLSELLDELLCQDNPTTLDADFVCQTIAYNWDESDMINFALNKYRGQRVAASKLCSFISKTFNIKVKPELVGKELTQKQFKHRRRSDGTYYDIPGEYSLFA